jgi:hypothetical protein
MNVTQFGLYLKMLHGYYDVHMSAALFVLVSYSLFCDFSFAAMCFALNPFYIVMYHTYAFSFYVITFVPSPVVDIIL